MKKVERVLVDMLYGLGDVFYKLTLAITMHRSGK